MQVIAAAIGPKECPSKSENRHREIPGPAIEANRIPHRMHF